jgi:hypothetical protein
MASPGGMLDQGVASWVYFLSNLKIWNLLKTLRKFPQGYREF